MNYIWNVLVRAKQREVGLEEIEFKLPAIYSPYMELSPEEINFTEVPEEIDVNPYYRFYEIFKDLFNPNYLRHQELREVFLDLTLHFLGQIDMLQGMNKIDYYKQFIYQDIKDGQFGETVKEGIDQFSRREKNIVLENICKFYKVGKHIYHLRDTVKRVFQGSILYVVREEINEVLLYVAAPKTTANQQKLEVIKTLFLPLEFKIATYWEYHFGVIGVAPTMEIGKTAIYSQRR